MGFIDKVWELACVKGFLEKNLLAIWYGNKSDLTIGQWLFYCLLIPLSLLTQIAVKQRFKKRIHLASKPATQPIHTLNPDLYKTPVIVVGNITVGGTGKSPLLLYLARYLINSGYRVGIVTRGYGGQTSANAAVEICQQSLASEVGDEPLMLWRQLNPDDVVKKDVVKNDVVKTPVVVCTARDKAVELINQRFNTDFILSDDGLQHYAMPRSFEIAVIDGQRGLGNLKLLPAGPLREPLSRLEYVDYILVNGERRYSEFQNLQNVYPNLGQFAVISNSYRPLNTLARVDSYIASEQQNTKPDALQLSNIIDTKKLSASGNLSASMELILVAGIGNPERFFTSVKDQLQRLSPLSVNPKFQMHAFPDHHSYVLDDFKVLNPAADSIVLMTEKDAVKCESFAEHIQAPVYAVDARLEPGEGMTSLLDSILKLVDNTE